MINNNHPSNSTLPDLKTHALRDAKMTMIVLLTQGAHISDEQIYEFLQNKVKSET